MKNIYSISRLNAINECMYQAFLTYKENKRGLDSIYTILGSHIHSELEKIVNGKSDKSNLKKALEKELEYSNLMGFEFIDNKVEKNYIDDMIYFCEHYQVPEGNFITEESVNYITPKGYQIRGYIDLQRINNDGSIDIYDYKTSSMFKSKEMIHHGRQLVVYALAKKQQGFKVNSLHWIMLKYITVTFYGLKAVNSKKKSLITKNVEICKIGKEFEQKLKSTMLFDNYSEEEASLISSTFAETNQIPIEYKNDFDIKPCYLNYNLTEDVIKECINYIEKTIEKWESAWEYPPKELTSNNTFYCYNICPHRKECQYISNYSQEQESEVNINDLF